jgi:iron complex outermembrane receptor protein
MSQLHTLRNSAMARAVRLALSLGAMAGVIGQAAAQDAAAPAEPLRRVEITGSAIKRIESETALPVQVITREEIDKVGVTTASEILARLSANVGGLTDSVSISDGKDQRGFNSANLRGIGTSSTLVLLNGRRMANFASPGDDTGVDLNNIPAAAIQRVEVLLDGASALYGTDAIGGVINFITRKDFQGLELNVYGLKTEEGGAGKRTASISAGHGDLAKDGYNVFAVLDVQRTGALSTSQRSFIDDLHIAERLPHLLSGYASPANIRLTGAQRDYLNDQGFTINGKPLTNRTINPSVPNCSPPANLYLPNGTGGVDACTYNYMGDTELYPKSEKTNLLSRGVLQLDPENQLYAEVALSRSKTWYAASSARVTGYLDYRKIPALAKYDLLSEDASADDDIPGEVQVNVRLNEAGRRTSELISESQRYVVGWTGSRNGWDYDVGLNHSVNVIKDRDTHGYLLYDQLMEGIADGRINPFGPSSPAGVELINSIQVNQEVRNARGTMDSLDFKVSHAIGALAGGDAALAVGGEVRREKTEFNPSDLLMSDNINNDAAPEGGQRHPMTAQRPRRVRRAAAAGRQAAGEAQLSARYDHYQQVGGAASPKIGLSYMPADTMLLRASAGRGFRAPSMTDLYRPTVYSSTATLPDPVYCATVDNNYADCADNWDTRRYSNENLKPERSRQFSLGAVLAAGRHVSLSLDYWNIKRTNLISEIGDDVHPRQPGQVREPGAPRRRRPDRLHRPAQGKPRRPDRQGTGPGDHGARHRHPGRPLRRPPERHLRARFEDPELAGRRLCQQPEPLRHRRRGPALAPHLTFDWERGPFVGQPVEHLVERLRGPELPPSTSMTAAWWRRTASNRTRCGTCRARTRSTRTLKVRLGVQNMFDKSPPYSNQAYFFLSGYDPTYTDVRGRRFYASANYAFK